VKREPRLGNFVLVCFLIAGAVEGGAALAARFEPDKVAQFAAAKGLVFYALPVVLCGIAAAFMGMWTRRSLMRNVLASLVCLFVPFVTAVLGVYISCMIMPECLI